MQNTQKLAFAALSPAHLPACQKIMAQAPDPWAADVLERAMDAENRYIPVVLLNGEAVGLACFLLVPESADLQQIVVAKAARGQGVAAALLTHGLAEIKKSGVQQCLLEVRAQNAPALALYKGCGFKALATRRGMYKNPQDDGILMAKEL